MSLSDWSVRVSDGAERKEFGVCDEQKKKLMGGQAPRQDRKSGKMAGKGTCSSFSVRRDVLVLGTEKDWLGRNERIIVEANQCHAMDALEDALEGNGACENAPGLSSIRWLFSLSRVTQDIRAEMGRRNRTLLVIHTPQSPPTPFWQNRFRFTLSALQSRPISQGNSQLDSSFSVIPL